MLDLVHVTLIPIHPMCSVFTLLFMVTSMPYKVGEKHISFSSASHSHVQFYVLRWRSNSWNHFARVSRTCARVCVCVSVCVKTFYQRKKQRNISDNFSQFNETTRERKKTRKKFTNWKAKVIFVWIDFCFVLSSSGCVMVVQCCWHKFEIRELFCVRCVIERTNVEFAAANWIETICHLSRLLISICESLDGTQAHAKMTQRVRERVFDYVNRKCSISA